MSVFKNFLLLIFNNKRFFLEKIPNYYSKFVDSILKDGLLEVCDKLRSKGSRKGEILRFEPKRYKKNFISRFKVFLDG